MTSKIVEGLRIENVSCNLCGNSETFLLYKSKDRLHGRRGTFNVVKCKTCGLVYINPRPTKDEIKYYYPNEYCAYKGALSKHSSNTYIDNQENKSRYEKIIRFKKGGRIIDIGCGDGCFLRYMKKNNWEVFGVEISELASNYARKEVGLNIFTGELLDAKFPNEHFDVVTLWAVIEHLHNPLGILTEINRILRRDGLLIFNTQNIESAEAKIFKNKWYHLDTPRHLYDFSPDTLKQMLTKTSFNILEMNVHSKPNMSGIPGSIRYLMYEFARKIGAPQLGKGCAILLSGIVSTLLKPICYLINKSGRGEVIEVYAIKREEIKKGKS